ncbi:uncharacterized protein [Epargyreus clarus]|uniref:uncharacterized protein n=1 Tax=Epargyreus clarus TaxID=520877 RepID=UPI003C2BB8A6
MVEGKSVIGTCIFALILTEVTTWTIDLPEVRKFFFERNEYKNGDKNKIYFNRPSSLVNYDNTEGNSLHNTPRLYEGVNGGYDPNGHYANEYGYHTYMEKKVNTIFHSGSIYLEGLRRAMELYSERLENCSKLEMGLLPTNRTWLPESESPLPSVEEATRTSSCEKVTRESEHIRRLASLVVWAIRELQDIAYAKDYDKSTKESEEDVLLLQLAWALDELARLTGYEPDAGQYATVPTPAPAPSTTPYTFFNLPIPNDGPTNSNCIKETNSPVPATIRCAVPLPDAVLQFLNISNSTVPNSPVNETTFIARKQEVMSMLASFSNSGSGQGQQTFNNMTAEQVRQLMLDCLNVTSDSSCLGFRSFIQFINTNYPQEQLPQRPNRETDLSHLEILEAAEGRAVVPLQRSRKRRSTNNPLKEFVTYYAKYKTWSNSNPETDGSTSAKSDSFDVKNELTPVKTVQKRSINVKDGIIVRVPEDPMQDLSNYVKHKPGVHYNKDSVQSEKIKAYVEKLFHSDGVTFKEHVRKLDKLIKSVHKRSVQYSRLHMPRVPENPLQDISYYVKYKPGTNIRPNLAHAVRVRAGLQEIFERGNIVVIRQYGSNYIPGVQPVTVGGIESFVGDI